MRQDLFPQEQEDFFLLISLFGELFQARVDESEMARTFLEQAEVLGDGLRKTGLALGKLGKLPRK